jgi:plasmid stabilization system protein ParE
MNKFTVELSDNAKTDFFEYIHHIIEVYKAPTTAAKHYSDFIKEFRKLEYAADIYQIQTRRYFQKFGINVRRVNYKKMTIIYTIHGNTVFINSIIATSTITNI